MSWIKTISESEASGKLKEIYDGLQKKALSSRIRGIAEIAKIFSLRPELLEARGQFGRAVHFGGSGLGRRREELIATAISGLLKCKY